MWQKFSRSAYTVLAWGFVACVAVQTFIAGLAVFTDPSRWGTHVMFVHLFEYLPILMLLFAFAGKLPGSEKWLCAALFGLIIVQYATANIPGAGALHPVIALALFWLSLRAARRPAGNRKEPAQARHETAALKENSKNRKQLPAVIALSLFGGLLAGFLISQFIGVLGYYVFGLPSWISWVRYLPFVTGIGSAIVVPILRHRRFASAA